MKILIVSTHPTHPAVEGNRRFISNQVELFERMGHQVYFLLIQRGDKDWGDNVPGVLNAMKEVWGNKLYVYKKSNTYVYYKNKLNAFRRRFNDGYIKCDDEYPSGLEKYVNQINEKKKFDACIINYYFLTKLFNYIDIPLKGITSHDCFSYKKLLINEDYTWLNTTPHEEAIAYQRCPHIFALNTEEAIFFSKLSPNSCVYNIFSSYTYSSSPIVGNHSILFLSGNNKYNINGLYWFLKKIFPNIIRRFPDCRLKIGGGISKVLEELCKDSNIDIVGYVDDFTVFYNSGDVVINPTYQGTGLKIKTFEGIAFDKVVMSHPHSRIGIFDAERAPLFSSEIPDEWVGFLEKIWSNENEIEKIKKENYQYIRRMNKYIESEYTRFFNSI